MNDVNLQTQTVLNALGEVFEDLKPSRWTVPIAIIVFIFHLLDVISDLYVTYQFYHKGQYG